MTIRFDLGAKPHLGYTGSVVERAADLRQDPAAIATLEADGRARTFVISGEFVIVRKGTPFNDPTFPLGAAGAFAPAREQVFLGRNDDAALFAVAIDPDAAEPLRSRSDLLVTDLRSLAVGALVAPEHLPPLAEAKSLLGWHRRHRFCSNCGAPTRLVQAGWRRDCAACGAQHFPRTDVVVPCGIRRAGRNHRRCGTAGNPGGGRHCMWPRHLFRVAAMALPDVADDRLSCPGLDDRAQ